VFVILSLTVGLVSRADLAIIEALVRAELVGLRTGDSYGELRLTQESAPEPTPRTVETTPLVSIVVNNFNYARFLSQSIESALAQTHPRTEVVVVDDASSDDSPDIIRAYGSRVIPILLEKNVGQGAAVNVGFAASHGDIIIFLDADDYLYPDASSRVVSSWAPGISKLQYRLHLVDSSGETIDLYPAPEVRFDSGDVVPLLLRAGRYETTVTSGNAFARGSLENVLPMPEAEFRIGADGYLVTVTPFESAVTRHLGGNRCSTIQRSSISSAKGSSPRSSARSEAARKLRSTCAAPPRT
jgi:glycosyltransferase involved in cell wall biosynthesis